MDTQLEKEWSELVATVSRLRAPNGCPWDREQTHQSLRKYLVEETYETLDVIDEIGLETPLQGRQDPRALALQEELGDVLLQILLHSEMASEVGAFQITDVVRGLREKLVRRHPHVFGDAAAAANSTQALAQWEKQKAAEKAAKKAAGTSSVLDGLPRDLPALQKTARLIEKVTKVGFQWPTLEGPMQKVQEEWAELRAEISRAGQDLSSNRARIASELGDLLFSLANVGYLLGVESETALRGTLVRFESRFRFVERRLFETGRKPEDASLEEMDRYWDEAKKIEKSQAQGST